MTTQHKQLLRRLLISSACATEIMAMNSLESFCSILQLSFHHIKPPWRTPESEARAWTPQCCPWCRCGGACLHMSACQVSWELKPSSQLSKAPKSKRGHRLTLWRWTRMEMGRFRFSCQRRQVWCFRVFSHCSTNSKKELKPTVNVPKQTLNKP